MTRQKNPGYTHDIIIIGGGLAGGTMAAMLGGAGFSVACIDRDPPVTQLNVAFDGRTTAISWGSRQVLEQAGVWDMLEADACAIRRIDILDGGSPVLLQFNAEEVGNRSFGWILENRLIRAALFKRMKSIKTIDYFAPAQARDIARDDNAVHVTMDNGQAINAPLLIGADGRASSVRDWAGIGVRGWTYDQRALVCTVIHDKPHGNVAVEHFRDQGPFAILPMLDNERGDHQSSIVWTEHGTDRDSMLHVPVEVFEAGLMARFPASYGRVRLNGKRFSYPLGLQHAHAYVAPRVALVADAAHGIHPIAGQGLNMGFRDLAALYQTLIAARQASEDFGSDTVLGRYQGQRRFDNMAMAGATDGLNKLFSTAMPPLPALRKAGLKLVASMPGAKQFFMKQAMGAAGLLPDMIRDAHDAA